MTFGASTHLVRDHCLAGYRPHLGSQIGWTSDPRGVRQCGTPAGRCTAPYGVVGRSRRGSVRTSDGGDPPAAPAATDWREDSQ